MSYGVSPGPPPAPISKRMHFGPSFAKGPMKISMGSFNTVEMGSPVSQKAAARVAPNLDLPVDVAAACAVGDGRAAWRVGRAQLAADIAARGAGAGVGRWDGGTA